MPVRGIGPCLRFTRSTFYHYTTQANVSENRTRIAYVKGRSINLYTMTSIIYAKEGIEPLNIRL